MSEPQVDNASCEPKKRSKRLPIVLGVIAAVLVFGAVGFSVWHAQPSFCNAICHSPMDSYVEGYYAEDGDLLVNAHAKANTTCIECHEPTINQQVSEGICWITGNFSDPMASRHDKFATAEFCNRCHDDGDPSTGIDRADIVVATADYQGNVGVNPHASHLTDLECGSCHSVHSASTLYCNNCHLFEAPEGWQ